MSPKGARPAAALPSLVSLSQFTDRQDFAYEIGEKYKEGKFILETELITERPELKREHVFKPRIEEIVRETRERDRDAMANQIPILNRS